MNRDTMRKLLILIGLTFCVTLGIFLIQVKNQTKNTYIKTEKIFFKLNGTSEIELYEGDSYNEPGFIVTNSENEELTDNVVVESNLDMTKEGNYKITYKVVVDNQTYTLERKIRVLKDQLKNIEFKLVGDEFIELIKEENFDDQLYTCTDKTNNTNCNNKVTITSNLDNKKIGTYTIEYILKLGNKEKKLTRVISVIDHPINTINFNLIGDKNIELIKGETYIDPLYTCVDKATNAKCDNYVTITNELDNNKLGTYNISYILNIKGKQKVLSRTVNVVEDPLKNIEFNLIGDKTINIYKNEKFTDPSYTCIDKTNNTSCTNNVKVENNVDNKKVGTYSIKYTLNIKNKQKTLIRTVNVIEHPIENIEFTLKGNKTISIYKNEKFIDPLYTCINKANNTSCTGNVTVTNKVNTSVVGIYTVQYKLILEGREKTLTRTVKIIENSLANIEFKLKGSSIINLLKNEKFTDPSYTCINKTNNKSCVSNVAVTNKVNTSVVGTYTVQYKLTLEGKVKVLTRTVNVLSKKYDYSLNNSSLTNSDVTIKFNSYISNLLYIVAPDNKKYSSKSISYTVKSNGTYKFIVYDNQNNSEEYNITVTNIDKTAPKISSCSSVIKDSKTTFTLITTATDISKYVVNDNTITNTSKTFTINSEIENGKVTAYDKAGNKSTITCSSYYEQIGPTGTENVKYNESTSTLKVWIELKERSGRTSFYTTHIWVKDAYNQFKSQVPNNYGKELVTAKGLLDNAISQDGLQNKLAVAVNASGFVKNGVWGQGYYNVNPLFNMTATSPLVLSKGKEIRNLSGGTLPSGVAKTYGLTKNGILEYYTYAGGTNTQSNLATASKIKNDGVLNTFSFSPVLVYEKKLKSSSTDKNIRQGFCQIDKNNFVFITDIYRDSRDGFSYKELGDYMLSLGCKYGYNLDGGGSTTLVFKGKNWQPLTLTGTNRQIADIIYFHE